MGTTRYTSARRTWLTALLLTLLVHAGAVVAVRALDVAGASETPPEPPIVDVVFAPPTEAQAPRVYTELPEDRADEPPEAPDLLSNVTSRARDAVPGGRESTPRLEGDSDHPAIDMAKGQETPPEPTPPVPDETVPAPPEPLSDDGAAPEVIPEPEPESPPAEALPAGQLFAQRAADRSSGNAKLPGDISLNTTAWEFAPWLRAFRQQFERHWIVPFGYRIGLIHGWTLLRLEIAPSGELLRLDVADEGGHTALRGASVTSMRSAAPFPALPPDFPEPTLLLEIKLNYPQQRRR